MKVVSETYGNRQGDLERARFVDLVTKLKDGRSNLFGVCFALAVGLAWINRFVQDDAFISFRYARHLAEGSGLVWNIGERVEGYTNFLWTLCLTPAFLFGWDPVLYSYTLSLMAYVCTLGICYWLASWLWRNWKAGLLCVILLATNFSFSSYATGGLETQFGIAWVLATVAALAYWQCYPQRMGAGIGAGVTSACAVMTRMDAVLLLVPFWLGATWRILCMRSCRSQRALSLAIGTAVLPVAGWLVWRHMYYGTWVPNTFLIKSAGVSWIRGAYYVALFYAVYGLWLFFPICWRNGRQSEKNPLVVELFTAWFLWQCYVIGIGGDFMEFRMMMPGLPFFMIVLSFCLLRLKRRLFILSIGILVVCSSLQDVCQPAYPCVDSIKKLKSQIVEWRNVADELTGILRNKESGAIKIGITCAGVIPFYTDAPCLDLLGLNDVDVAKKGARIQSLNRWLGNRPGHVVMAQWRQVLDKKVHLLVNTPWMFKLPTDGELLPLKADEVIRCWYWGKGWNDQRVSAAMVPFRAIEGYGKPIVVAWPCGKGKYLITLYVKRDPVIDQAIVRCHATVVNE